VSTLDKLGTAGPELGSGGLPLTGLPRPFYTSSEWFERDIEKVFRRRWLFVCHVSEIKSPGDFVTFELVDENIIVARDRNGSVNAFHNVCRHRGARLCKPERGNAKAFVCPFHAWTYNVDGTLRAAPQMPRLDKERFGLKTVWCEVWNGMVFINLMADQPQPVAEYLRSVKLEDYQLDKAKVIATRSYTIYANWKLNGETYQECYHCAGVHTNSLMPLLNTEALLSAFDDPLAAAHGHDEVVGEFLMHAKDLRKGGFAPGVETESCDGKFASKRLLGDGSVELAPSLTQWFPNWSIGAFPDTAFIIDWIPVSATETIWRTRWLVHEEAVEGQDYSVEHIVKLADTFNLEDKTVVELAQQGINSKSYEPGPLHQPLENEVRKYLAHYLSMVTV
jgi:phenylpropionate dioxygenase-like ring-hydroxylating dioxygenase large terminal subunit